MLLNRRLAHESKPLKINCELFQKIDKGDWYILIALFAERVLWHFQNGGRLHRTFWHWRWPSSLGQSTPHPSQARIRIPPAESFRKATDKPPGTSSRLAWSSAASLELPYHTWPAGAAISTCVIFPSSPNTQVQGFQLWEIKPGFQVWWSLFHCGYLGLSHSESSSFCSWSKLKTRQPKNAPSWMGSLKRRIFHRCLLCAANLNSPSSIALMPEAGKITKQKIRASSVKLMALQGLFWYRDLCESSLNPQCVRQDFGKSQNEDNKTPHPLIPTHL